MQYRTFGKTKEKVSVLGFGCMRFQTNSDDPKDINEELAIKQIRHAVDNGVNYIDTAYPYHGKMSEPLTGKALKDGYREKVNLATKHPCWLVEEEEDFDKYLNEQLEKLDTDYIDFYLIHALNQKRWDNLQKHNMFDFLDRVKKAGEEGLNYAADKGLGIIVMEPLRGGKLTKKVPDDINEIWESSGRDWSPAQWAFKFVWNNPKVHLVLSGMNEIKHIDENIKTAENTPPNSLTEEDLKTIEKAEKIYNSRIVANCTDCKCCMPCPNGVDIPANIDMINDAYMFDDIEGHRKSYKKFIEDEKKAYNCIKCGLCEPKCPQKISIMEVLERVDKELG